ncbi:MAG: hypothetical protein K6U87_10145 [Firmicutes bacterium]|nr:hypothetical protein [Bacillota bacterium]
MIRSRLWMFSALAAGGLSALAACSRPAPAPGGYPRPPHGLYNHTRAPAQDRTVTRLPSHGTGETTGPGTVRTAEPGVSWLSYDPVYQVVALHLAVQRVNGGWQVNGRRPEDWHLVVPPHWRLEMTLVNRSSHSLVAQVRPQGTNPLSVPPGQVRSLRFTPDHPGVWRLWLQPGPAWMGIWVRPNHLPGLLP